MRSAGLLTPTLVPSSPVLTARGSHKGLLAVCSAVKIYRGKQLSSVHPGTPPAREQDYLLAYMQILPP